MSIFDTIYIILNQVGHMREIEIKVRVDNFNTILSRMKDLNIQVSPPIIQKDTVYKFSNKYGNFSKDTLRIRDEKDHLEVTLKIRNSRSSDNTEISFGVTKKESVSEFFNYIGATEIFTIKKTRRTATYKECTICLDKVDNLGSYVEFEMLSTGTVDPAIVTNKLKEYANELGLNPNDVIEEGYTNMLIKQLNIKVKGKNDH